MTSPYITPAMLLNQAPFGIAWSAIPNPSVAPGSPANLAALEDICWVASSQADTYCNMPLRASADVETIAGPDYRATINQGGTCILEMQHWPVLAVLGGQVSPSNIFPRTWNVVPASGWAVWEPSAQLVGESSVPSGGGDGMNTIGIIPGYVDWVNGRAGYSIMCAYINGWPVAGLDQSVSAGATSVHVDDVTGMVGCMPRIWDSGSSETVTVTAAVADNPVNLIPGAVTGVNAGPGTLTLASPLQYSHTATSPTSVLVSAMPAVVRDACYYYAAAEAMQRGSTAFTVQAMPGSTLTGGQPSTQSFITSANRMLCPLRRVF